MNSLDPSCVPEQGLKLQSVSVYKDKPKALSSLLCVGGLPGAWDVSLAAEGEH